MHEIYCHACFCLVLKLISFIAEQKEVDFFFFFLRASGAEYQNIPVSSSLGFFATVLIRTWAREDV